MAPHSPHQTDLTILVPTHNRPGYCAAQLRFFRECGVRHRIMVADSSRAAEANAVRAACSGIAEYWFSDLQFYDKLLAAVSRIDTPFVALAPDDDIVFPHAIDAARAFLKEHPDYAVAHGYTLYYGMHDKYFDVHSVYTFVPSIDKSNALERHYNLMRRYQPFIWAVVRREVLLSALTAVQAAVPLAPLFREFMFMNVVVLQGKIAMLPIVYAMRGMEESTAPITTSHPLFAFLDDSRIFFHDYLTYRNHLVDFIRENNFVSDDRRYPSPVSESSGPMIERLIDFSGSAIEHLIDFSGSTIEHLIDLTHAIWLGREADLGSLNHAVERLLGLPKPVLRGAPVWPGWRELGEGDLAHSGANGRRYIWRHSVLAAEPRDEIRISSEEISRVEHELEMYRL